MPRRGSQSRVNRRTKKTAGSFGSASNSVEKLHQVLTHVPASVQDRRVSPSQGEMQRAISNGECPFCGAKFRNIAAHTNRSHGVDKLQLKDILGIPKSRPACSPDLSKDLSDSNRRYFSENPDAKKRLVPMQKGRKRNISKAGKLVNMAKLEKARQALEAAALEAGADNGNAWVGKLNTERRRRETAERDRRIIDLAAAGLGSAEIRQQMKVDNSTIKRALKHYGCDVDMRSRRPGPPPEQIAAAHARLAEEIDKTRHKRLENWRRSNKDWEAVHDLAAEWEISPKAAVAWLRKQGESPPDGRLTPKRAPSSTAETRLAQWRELGRDWNAILVMSEQLNLRPAGLAQYLRLLGEQVPDGRSVSPNRFHGGVSR